MFGDIIVGVDIGATKVCTVIVKTKKQNQIEVLGYGMSACSGIKKGLIVDIESVARAIKESVSMAEKSAGVKVSAVTIAISGFHTVLVPSRGKINFEGEMREITSEDVSRVLKEAKSFELPYDRQVVDVIPKQYIINGYDEIVDPTGMMGAILEVDAEVVLGNSIATQSLLKSVEKAGYQVSAIIVEALATSEVVLSDEEKQLGVLLLDVGGGKTDIALFKNDRIEYYDSIPIGSEHITNDIVISLKVSYNEADRLKKQFPLSQKSLINNDQSITIYSIGENRQKIINISDVIDVVEARIAEIFTILKERLDATGLKERIEAGIVIVGQGVYHIAGSDEVAAGILKIPTRFVNPKLPGGLKLPYVTALGIVKYVAGMSLGERDVEILNGDRISEQATTVHDSLATKIIKFFKQ